MKAILGAREKVVSNAVVTEKIVDMTLKELADERKEEDELIVRWEVGEDDLGIGTT